MERNRTVTEQNMQGLADYLRAQASVVDVLAVTQNVDANTDTLRNWAAEVECARAILSRAPVDAALPEPQRPDILERLSYHALERDDLTLDDCLAYLSEGWKSVHGRTERQMVMQILAQLAGAVAAPSGVPAGTRAKFEAWGKTQGTPQQGWWFRQVDDGGYSAHEADIAWKAWCAALAAPSGGVPADPQERSK
jgi:hypothetical protein